MSADHADGTDATAMREQVFLKVAFDFEYIADDSKKIFIKEEEVLMLIAKTNHDWWQVIRRGDSRPFFAPAKYVIEMTPEEIDARRKLKPPEISPLPTNDRSRENRQMSTFAAAATPTKNSASGAKMFNSNKKSNYSPTVTQQHNSNKPIQGIGPMEHIFGNSRFQERYRSNSLDSILVADLNAKKSAQVTPNRFSTDMREPVLYNHPLQQAMITTSGGGGSGGGRKQSRTLEKRPTFENSLDKRRSWSVETSSVLSTVPAGAPVSKQMGRRHMQQQQQQQQQQQAQQQLLQQQILQAAASKPSKSSKSRISAYQNTQGLVFPSASKSTTAKSETEERRKKPVPLPRSKIPVPSSPTSSDEAKPKEVIKQPLEAKSSLHSRFFSKRSKTDLGSDGLSAYKAKKYPAPKVPNFERPVPQKRSPVVPLLSPAAPDVSDNSAGMEPKHSDDPVQKKKPEVKEKPLFSTFKQQQPVSKTTTWQKRAERVSMTKMASESDLIKSVDQSEPSSIITISSGTEAREDNPASSYYVQLSTEDEDEDGMVKNKLVIDTSKYFPEADSVANGAPKRSEPLQISMEPLNDREDRMSESADRSCSTSFGSTDDNPMLTDRSVMDDSADSANILSTTPTLGSAEALAEDAADRTMSPSAVSTTSRSPPSPGPLGLTPIRTVMPEWNEYEDAPSGRKFYYNSATKEKSWKPPRKPKTSIDGHSNSASPVPPSELDNEVIADTDVLAVDNTSQSNEIPSGYETKTDAETGSQYFVNVFTGVRWFCAKDDNGKTYFYEENGNESCWRLPNVSQSIQDGRFVAGDSGTGARATRTVKKPLTGVTKRMSEKYQQPSFDKEPVDSSDADAEASPPKPKTAASAPAHGHGMTKTEMLERKFTLPVSSPNFQIGNVNIVVVKQGPLHKTKMVENGKRLRKNWCSCHAVLTDTFLLFFKDAKTFASLQSGAGSNKPDQCIDLKSAIIEWSTGDKSKRHNVFELSTLLGVTMLLQDDSLQVAAEWFQEIKEVVEALDKRGARNSFSACLPLNLGHAAIGASTEAVSAAEADNERKLSDASVTSSTLQLPTLDKKKQQGKVSRTKSLKMKILGVEDAPEAGATPTASSAPVVGVPLLQHQASSIGGSNKSNIREKLRRFFQRRPTMDDLFKKGIIKNEPVFGSTLRELELSDGVEVPHFVRKCIAEIEKGDFLKTDGVYRQSGNLSHVQRIRLQVDQGNLAILESVDDVHVLTGALKLFFRELKEPLIPWDCVERLMAACSVGAAGQVGSSGNRKNKVKLMKDAIVQLLPPSHKATLFVLLRHLLRVTEYKDLNRMQIPNLAIVFGPTLMWPPSSLVTQNLALDMMQQNIIVETLLNNAQQIF